MNAPAKLGLFAVVLATALGVGAALGAAVGPIDVGTDPTHEAEEHEPVDGATTTTHLSGHGEEHG